MGKVATDVTLADVASAIREFKEDSMSYSALVAFRAEFDDFQSMIESMVGSPLTASLASQMTDTTKVYIYVGTETGYTKGDWYYYNPSTSTWVDGGIYNATAVDVATMEEIQSYIT